MKKRTTTWNVAHNDYVTKSGEQRDYDQFDSVYHTFVVNLNSLWGGSAGFTFDGYKVAHFNNSQALNPQYAYIDEVSVNGGYGNDVFVINRLRDDQDDQVYTTNRPTDWRGSYSLGHGNDTVISTQHSDDGIGYETIDGGEGNDYIHGGIGDDSIIGGSGNDTLVSGDGADTILGGDGDDYILLNDSPISGTYSGDKHVEVGPGNNRVTVNLSFKHVPKVVLDKGHDLVTVNSQLTKITVTPPKPVPEPGDLDWPSLLSGSAGQASGAFISYTLMNYLVKPSGLTNPLWTPVTSFVGVFTAGALNNTFRTLAASPGESSTSVSDESQGTYAHIFNYDPFKDTLQFITPTNDDMLKLEVQVDPGLGTAYFDVWDARDLRARVEVAKEYVDLFRDENGKLGSSAGAFMEAALNNYLYTGMKVTNAAGTLTLISGGDVYADGAVVTSPLNGASSTLDLSEFNVPKDRSMYILGNLGGQTFEASSLSPFVTGTAGADVLTNGHWVIGKTKFQNVKSNVQATMHGGGGGDLIIGGATIDHLYGGDGDDIIVSAGGDDVLHGGNGRDTFLMLEEFLDSTGLNTSQPTVGNDGRNTVLDFGEGDRIVVGIAASPGDLSFAAGRASDVVEMRFAGYEANAITFENATSVQFSARMNDGRLEIHGHSSKTLQGTALAERLFGNASNNAIVSNGGADTVAGLGGDDTVVRNTTKETGQLVYTDFNFGDSIEFWGARASEFTMEQDGADLLLLIRGDRASAIRIPGLSLENVQITANEQLRSGVNVVSIRAATSPYITGSDADNFLFGDGRDTTLRGNGGNDTLDAGAGNDHLWGDAGNDVLRGGAGTDTFHIAGNDVVEDFEAGDLLRFESYGLMSSAFQIAQTGSDMRVSASNGYSALLTGMNRDGTVLSIAPVDGGLWSVRMKTYPDWSITGSWGYDYLSGTPGDDILDGVDGQDTMAGGSGDDVYILGYGALGRTTIIEKPGNGSDTVYCENSHVLAANVENLALSGTFSVSGTGNVLNNHIAGNDGSNVLSGLDGEDTMNGFAGDDTLDGGEGRDFLYGGEGNDRLSGGAGSDVFHVFDADAPGMDTIGDFSRDDRIVIDNTAVSAAQVSFTQAGADVQMSIAGHPSHTVTLQNRTITGLVAVDTGSGVVVLEGPQLSGTAGGDILAGDANGNLLLGLAGDDAIAGLGGDDTIDGGTGADTMAGGTGNDRYIVDNSSDLVVEKAGEGTDAVESGIDYRLAEHVENLLLTGGSSLRGTGNDLANYVTGNAGNNTLDGGAGNDTMAGGAGDDVYIVDSAGDVVNEIDGQGTDTILASVSYTLLGRYVENLMLTGGADTAATGNRFGNSLAGNDGNNTLMGNDGNDTLHGGAGNDTLTGGTGSDEFRFVCGTSGADTIADFAPDDRIFITGATAAQVSVGLSGSDRVIRLSASTDTITLTGKGMNQVTVADAAGGVRISVSATSPYVEGTAGNDDLKGAESNDTLMGMDGNDTLSGLAGDDILDGGGGSNRLDGGAGMDVYQLWCNGVDTVLGLEPGDTIVFRNPAVSAGSLFFCQMGADMQLSWFNNGKYAPVAVLRDANKPGTQFRVEPGSGPATLIMTRDGAQDLTGTFANEAFLGDARNNFYDGGDGSDLLIGGIGSDTLHGGGGDDMLVDAEAGARGSREYLDGGDGNDYLYSLSDYSTVMGGAGDDYIFSIGSGKRIEAGAGNDIIDFSFSSDTKAFGDGGNDTFKGGAGNDSLWGDDGNDSISGGEGNDQALGGAGDDSIDGGNGNDHLLGEGGNDTIRAGDGEDTLSGGAGDDLLDGQLAVTLKYFEGGSGNDTFRLGYWHGWQDARTDEFLSIVKDFELGGGSSASLDRIVICDSSVTQEELRFSSIVYEGRSSTKIGFGGDVQSDQANLNAIVLVGVDLQDAAFGFGTENDYVVITGHAIV